MTVRLRKLFRRRRSSELGQDEIEALVRNAVAEGVREAAALLADAAYRGARDGAVAVLQPVFAQAPHAVEDAGEAEAFSEVEESEEAPQVAEPDPLDAMLFSLVEAGRSGDAEAEQVALDNARSVFLDMRDRVVAAQRELSTRPVPPMPAQRVGGFVRQQGPSRDMRPAVAAALQQLRIQPTLERNNGLSV